MNKGRKTTAKREGNEGALPSELATLKSRYEECVASLKKVEFDLGERSKELRCQNRMSEIFADLSLDLDDICLQVLELIPPAWQFPDRTGAMIVLEEHVFRTEGFSEKSPHLQQEIMSEGVKVGEVRISVKVPNTKTKSEPFLREENDLIHSIALRLGNVVALKKREQARRKGEALYHSILSASPDVITITDLEGKIRFSSERSVKMFGASSATEYTGHSMLEYIDPSDHEKARGEIGKMLSGQLSGAAEYTAVRADGSKFDIEVNGEFLRDENGQPVQMIFVTRDITDRKNAELLVSQSEQKYKALFEYSPDGYLIFQDGIFVECNKTSEHLVGGSRSDIIGKRPDEISPVYQPNGKRSFDYVIEVVNEAFATGKNEFEWTHKRVDGSEFLALIHLAPVIFEDRDALLVSWKDITALRHADEEIRKFRTITDKANYGVAIAYPDGEIIYVNPVWARMHGWEIGELLGKNISMFHSGKQLEEVGVSIKKLMETGEFEALEIGHTRKDGSTFPTLMSAIVVTENQQPLYMSATALDITELKKSQEQLVRSEEQLNYAQEIANMGSWDLDLLTGKTSWSKNYYRLIERDPGTFKPNQENFMKVVHQEDQSLIDNKLKEIIKTKASSSIDMRLVMPDGRIKWVVNHVVPEFRAGQLSALHGVNIDITAKKEQEIEINRLNASLEEKIVERTAQLSDLNNDLLSEIDERKRIAGELQEKSQELEQFFNVALDLLCIADTSGNFIKVNKAWEDILGYAAADLEKKQFLEFVHPDDIQATLDAMVSLDKQNSIINFTNRYRCHDGQYRNIEWHSVPVGPTIYAAARDVTQRMKNEEDLLLARKEAELANLAKSEFLSRMSHELRTPMNSILGFAQLLDRGELNQGQKKGVHHILSSGKHLLELINEVLDISRIEAGRISFSPEPVQVHGVIAEMIDLVQIMANTRQVQLQVIDSDAIRQFIKSDRQRLKQILLNLINNAIKYNHDGGTVWISAENVPESQLGVEAIRILVKDTGMGISRDDIPKLFIPFERIGAENTETEGTGLGLAVVKKLMDLMGGIIGVESTRGEGSTFWILMPRADSQYEQIRNNNIDLESKVSERHWEGRILYIEDNKPNIDLIENIINAERPGIKLITAVYGKLAHSMAVELKPDLILLDLNLPDIHGSEVLHILKSDEITHLIPVVIITADAVQSHIKPLLKAGAIDCITKPLEIDHFLTILDRIFKKV